MRIMRFTKRLFKKLVFKDKYLSNIDYWEKRAAEMDGLAVLNKKHTIDEIDQVTEKQVKAIFPHLTMALNGKELTTLDFGCGTGRFSIKLAGLIGGKVLAVDPIQHLINLAPKHDSVTYSLIKNGKIPATDNYFDIIWVCLVLGGITENELRKTVDELIRVGKSNALYCIVENTSDKSNGPHWHFRSNKFYSSLFDCGLNEVSSYQDINERISIMIGRRR